VKGHACRTAIGLAAISLSGTKYQNVAPASSVEHTVANSNTRFVHGIPSGRAAADSGTATNAVPIDSSRSANDSS